jgi:hypothetical protein
MEKSCLNCHFFCKQSTSQKKDINPPKISLSEAEREHLGSFPKAIDSNGFVFSANSLMCSIGNWSMNPGPLFYTTNQSTFMKNRDRCSSFIPHRPGMELLEVAKFTNSELREKFPYITVALLIFMVFPILMAGFAVAFLR